MHIWICTNLVTHMIYMNGCCQSVISGNVPLVNNRYLAVVVSSCGDASEFWKYLVFLLCESYFISFMNYSHGSFLFPFYSLILWRVLIPYIPFYLNCFPSKAYFIYFLFVFNHRFHYFIPDSLNMSFFLDFRLSPWFEYWKCSFGYFPGVKL